MTPIRVAVTGASGLLGTALIRRLAVRGHHVTAGVHDSPLRVATLLERHPLDLLTLASVRDWIQKAMPEWIVHCAAWTDVDGCEREPTRAQMLNVDATANLIQAINQSAPGARVLYLSTDYVFDGLSGPYDENTPTAPIGVYGQTKIDGERLVFGANSKNVLVRSASFVGVGQPDRPTFAESMLLAMHRHPPLRLAIDQYSNVTSVGFLAEAIVEILETGSSGVWHVAGSEVISRFELGSAIAREFDLPGGSVTGVPYASLGRAAARPLRGGLLSKRALSTRSPSLDHVLRSWKSDLIAAGRWHES